ncbi:MAG TPA: NUDIX domain-containing protein [Candidatus Limnocylindrales bacterium]|nr:NUDIX domain-containing protein [Candidatus Limnocylindrales bacterium]
MTEPAGSAKDPAGLVSATNPAAADLTEVIVESDVIRRGRNLTFRVDTIERADGSRAKREIVGHPGAVAILAIDADDNVLMVRQFRVAAGRALLEVPAGTLDVDATTGAVEDHALAAPRELEEETGYRAGSWRLLTSFWTAPGFATELMHLYLATDLRPAHDDRLGPDEDERLELARVPWQNAIAAAERGEIADAKSLVALLWLDRLTQPPSPASGTESTAATETAAAGATIVRATYTPSLWEHIRAGTSAARRSRLNLVVSLTFFLAAIWLALNGNPFAAIIVGSSAALLITGLFLVPVVGYAYRRRSDLFRQPTDVSISPDGIDFRGAAGQSHLAWTTFSRVRETAAEFFLETGVSTLFVPKRAFTPDQLTTFRRLVAEAGFGPDGRRVAV